ncbi:MAG TPA: cytochrome c-type biogenesis protein CcmH [Acidimicrobiales bacterium]|jgi:cytochrome c-type biogenesis protein CcmH|nr:cytochrome c-type biogenesis protein CcmH [Acidimicrobiales bacterium]
MVLVVAGVLAVGSQRSGRPTVDQRVTSLAAQVRCPVCQGETAAESDTPPSVEIRSFIRRSLQEGRSPAQVKSSLVADYGPGILEQPQAKGVALVVWVLPVAAVIVAVAGLTLAFRRWRRQLGGGGEPSDADRDLVDRALAGGLPSDDGQAGEVLAASDPDRRR